MTNLIPFLLLLLLVPLAFLAVLLWSGRQWSRESAALVLKAFLWGAAAGFPLLFLRWLVSVLPVFNWTAMAQRSQLGPVPTLIILLLVTAIVLEWLKNRALLIALAGNQVFLRQLGDGVLYGAAAAIGFSLINNASFLVTDVTRFAWPDFAAFAAHTAGRTFLYLLTTMAFGLYYAMAASVTKAKRALVPALTQNRVALTGAWRLHQLRKHWLAMTGQPCDCRRSAGAILAEGWFLVVVLHAVYLLLQEFVY